MMTEQERYQHFWREVVYQAVRDLLCPEMEGCGVEERADAYEWLWSESEQPGSFLWACREGGVSAKAVREELRLRGVA